MFAAASAEVLSVMPGAAARTAAGYGCRSGKVALVAPGDRCGVGVAWVTTDPPLPSPDESGVAAGAAAGSAADAVAPRSHLGGCRTRLERLVASAWSSWLI